MPHGSTAFPPLNLPGVNLNIRPSTRGDFCEVFCQLRKKWVALTPEERVRQYFTAWMIKSLDYRSGLMANEMTISLNGMSRRCDTVIFTPDGLSPVAIVEYKAPHIKITREVFNQAARYNIVLKTPMLLISNGLTHYCAIVKGERSITFLKEIPSYPALLGLLDRNN